MDSKSSTRGHLRLSLKGRLSSRTRPEQPHYAVGDEAEMSAASSAETSDLPALSSDSSLHEGEGGAADDSPGSCDEFEVNYSTAEHTRKMLQLMKRPISASSTDSCQLGAKAGSKRRKKHFKGLRYSFVNRKCKRRKHAAAQSARTVVMTTPPASEAHSLVSAADAEPRAEVAAAVAADCNDTVSVETKCEQAPVADHCDNAGQMADISESECVVAAGDDEDDSVDEATQPSVFETVADDELNSFAQQNTAESEPMAVCERPAHVDEMSRSSSIAEQAVVPEQALAGSADMAIEPLLDASCLCESHTPRMLAVCSKPSASRLLSASGVLEADAQTAIYCQAIDSIAERNIGCCNRVVHDDYVLPDGRGCCLMLRPSTRVTYLALCAYHRQRLRQHHCCPVCGVFCTQGVFMCCQASVPGPGNGAEGAGDHGEDGEARPAVHLFHKQCSYRVDNKSMQCVHCQSHTSIRRVHLRLMSGSGHNSVAFFASQKSYEMGSLNARISMSVAGGRPNQISKADSLQNHRLATLSDNIANFVDRTLFIPSRDEICQALAVLKAPTSAHGVRANGYTIEEQLSIIFSRDIAAFVTLARRMRRPNGANGWPLYPDRRTIIHQLAVNDHSVGLFLLHALCPQLDLNALDADSNTPLMLAVKQKCERVARALLLCGACDHLRGPDGMMALHMAAREGNLGACKFLLSAARTRLSGVAERRLIAQTLDCRDDGGWTPLVWAVEHKQLPVVNFLLGAGADPSTCDEEQNVPLHWSAYSGCVQIGWALIRSLAHARQSHTAAHTSDGDCSAVSAYVNVANVHGDTPLHVAARQGHREHMFLLLSNGANCYMRNSAGKLPLDICLSDECLDCIELHVQLHQLRSSLSFNCSPLGSAAEAENGAGGSGSASDAEVGCTRVLSVDISDGKERMPIQIVSARAGQPLPTDYTYVAHNCHTSQLDIDTRISATHACQCVRGVCSRQGLAVAGTVGELATSVRDHMGSGRVCACASLSLGCWYNADGRLLSDFSYADPPLVFECNRACLCNRLTCNNRCVQHGITLHLQVFDTGARGWGVRCVDEVARGTFVCEYVGELISDSEADQREDDSYLFDLENQRDNGGEAFCIDARRYGNVARFINHSCAPNLVSVKVFVEHQDLRFPRIALFASRDIAPMEELAFEYGEKFWVVKYKKFTCQCGASTCKYSADVVEETVAKYRRRLEAANKPH